MKTNSPRLLLIKSHVAAYTKKDGTFVAEHNDKRQKKKADGKTKAVAGGQTGMNGYHYKGGQFLPSTMAEPGKWKVGKKWVTTGRELVSPGKFEVQPTPFSRSLYTLLGPGYMTVIGGDGKAKMNPGANGDGVRGHDGKPITPETMIRPGVKGVLGKHEFSLKDLIDQYNKGARWIEIEPPEGVEVKKA